MAWENAVGAVGGLASSVAGLIEGGQQNKLNRQVFEYNKDLNAQKMAREDNAVQRRAADLRAAGLSKTLAAGSAASSQAGDQVSPPKLTRFDKFSQGLQLGQQITDIMSAGAKADLDRAQATGIAQQNQVREAQIKLYQQQLENLITSGKIDTELYDYMHKYGFKMPTAPLWPGILISGGRSIKKIVNDPRYFNSEAQEAEAFVREGKGFSSEDYRDYRDFVKNGFYNGRNLNLDVAKGKHGVPEYTDRVVDPWKDMRKIKEMDNYERQKFSENRNYVSDKYLGAVERESKHDWQLGQTAFDRQYAHQNYYKTLNPGVFDYNFGSLVQELFNGLGHLFPALDPMFLGNLLSVAF